MEFLVYLHTTCKCADFVLWLLYYEILLFPKHIAAEYSHYISTSYCGVVFVFELLASSVLLQNVVVFCHITAARHAL